MDVRRTADLFFNVRHCLLACLGAVWCQLAMNSSVVIEHFLYNDIVEFPKVHQVHWLCQTSGIILIRTCTAG